MKKKIEEMFTETQAKMKKIEEDDPVNYVSKVEWMVLLERLRTINDILKLCR